MMFYGQHTIHVSDKKTISLPDQFIEELQSNIFITQGFESNLIIMPENVFLDLYQSASTMNITSPLARLFLRHFLANAAFVPQGEIDHIQISCHLYEYAGLPKEEAAVVVGQGNHIEMWGQKKWQEQYLKLQDSTENAHRFAALDIRTN